jgi:hypothetical protein
MIVIPLANGEIKRIPIDRKGQMLINYQAAYPAYSRHSFVSLLANYNRRKQDPQAQEYLTQFKDKLLLIGLTATGTVDFRLTPIDGLSPGVGVQAGALNAILQQNFVTRLPKTFNLLILILLGLALGEMVPRLTPLRGLGLCLAAILLIAFSALLLFNLFNIWIDVVNPFLVITLSYPLILINQYITERFKNRLLSQELTIAHKIQQSFLPHEIPQLSNYRFAATTVPARQVGGDLYDFKPLGKEAISIAIGDVSGKGVPAALYMAKAISDFRSRAESNPAISLSRINRTLCQEGTAGMFLTFLNLVLFPASNTLLLSNAGHHPAIKLGTVNEKVEFLDAPGGMPLGIMPEIEFFSAEFSLQCGEILILFTDGVEEAVNRKGLEFGKERLIQAVAKNKFRPPEAILAALLAQINEFSYGMPQHDDITLVAIQRTA